MSVPELVPEKRLFNVLRVARVGYRGDCSVDKRLRRAVIKFSILRFDDALPDLRLRSMHNPDKKHNTISAVVEGAIEVAGSFSYENKARLRPWQRNLY
jgi:hypothetical protein